MSTSLNCEGNRTSGVSTYGLNGLRKGDKHPADAPEYGPLLPYLYVGISVKLCVVYSAGIICYPNAGSH